MRMLLACRMSVWGNCDMAPVTHLPARSSYDEVAKLMLMNGHLLQNKRLHKIDRSPPLLRSVPQLTRRLCAATTYVAIWPVCILFKIAHFGWYPLVLLEKTRRHSSRKIVTQPIQIHIDLESVAASPAIARAILLRISRPQLIDLNGASRYSAWTSCVPKIQNVSCGCDMDGAFALVGA